MILWVHIQKWSWSFSLTLWRGVRRIERTIAWIVVGWQLREATRPKEDNVLTVTFVSLPKTQNIVTQYHLTVRYFSDIEFFLARAYATEIPGHRVPWVWFWILSIGKLEICPRLDDLHLSYIDCICSRSTIKAAHGSITIKTIFSSLLMNYCVRMTP